MSLAADHDAFDAAGVTGIVWRRIDPVREAEAEALLHKLMLLAREMKGFQGSEIFPPISGVQDAHVVLYRFNSGENLRRWLESAERRETLRQVEALLLEPSFEFFFAHRRRAPGTVSSVFSYRIRAGCEEQFRDWRRRIVEASRTWEGFLGTESFDTPDSATPEFVVVVRFDNRAHLEAWLQCDVRAVLITEVHRYVEDYRVRRIGSGFEGWFEYANDASPPAPWRQGMVILAALFPVIMILRHVLEPVFVALPFPLAFLILLAIDVALLTYFIMPHFSRVMNFWLCPKPPHSWRTELAGWLILVAIIVVTLVVTLIGGL